MLHFTRRAKVPIRGQQWRTSLCPRRRFFFPRSCNQGCIIRRGLDIGESSLPRRSPRRKVLRQLSRSYRIGGLVSFQGVEANLPKITILRRFLRRNQYKKILGAPARFFGPCAELCWCLRKFEPRMDWRACSIAKH